MSDVAEKIHLIEARVGSQAWVGAVQECILDNRSLCFACGDAITYRLDFFYMRGYMGTTMIHDRCFDFHSKSSRAIVPSVESDLPPGEWLSLNDAAAYLGIAYSTLYQRVWTSSGRASGGFEKRNGQWFASRAALEAMPKGKFTPGRPLKSSTRTKSRTWRSEVTEEIPRISSTEAARRIGMSRSWLLSRRDQFFAIKVDGVWRLSEKLVDEYVRNDVDGLS